MNEQIATIVVAGIWLVGSIVVAGFGFVGSIVTALIAAKFQVSKDIKKLSGNLPSWELLYEHAANGNRIDGEIEHLCEAIGKAYPIKVKIYREENQFEMMDAQWVFVKDKLVHATNIDQISLIQDQAGTYTYQSDAYHYYVIVNSKGYHHASRVYIDGRKGDATADSRRMVWFGLVPPT